MYTSMVSPDLINIHLDVNTQEELFQTVGEILYEKGYVNEGYIRGISEREKMYPTGLATQNLNIALPHSDTKFIETPFIYVVRNSKPIRMLQMGDNAELDCHYFFFLGIKEPDKQVGLLAKLMELFMDQPFVEALQSMNEHQEMYELIKNNI